MKLAGSNVREESIVLIEDDGLLHVVSSRVEERRGFVGR